MRSEILKGMLKVSQWRDRKKQNLTPGSCFPRHDCIISQREKAQRDLGSGKKIFTDDLIRSSAKSHMFL